MISTFAGTRKRVAVIMLAFRAESGYFRFSGFLEVGRLTTGVIGPVLSAMRAVAMAGSEFVGHEPISAISALMLSTLQARVRGPSSVPAGKRPDLTPAHQVARLTGISGGIPRLEQPIIWGRRR